jgi:CHASE2 domain-containing sensor protein
MNWWLLILVIVVLFVASKLIHFKHAKHKIFILLMILLIAFLYFSFTTVVQSHSIDLKTASGVFSASKIYFSWLGNAFNNVKTVSGNVIKMDWIPKNVSLTGAVTSGSSSSSDDGW